MIAVDAMGGDFAPDPIVKGALNVARKGVSVTLFGDQKKISSILSKFNKNWRNLPVEVVHCEDVIEMGEIPGPSLIKRSNSSLIRAMRSVAIGHCDAFVSAGNSGAVVLAATLISKRIPKISRAALGDFLPACHGEIFFVDLGANIDCKPEQLVQFAIMGSTYVALEKKINSPSVALLSNGHESYKGSLLVKETHKLLTKSKLNFIGNIESRVLFEKCDIDVVVCDGFVGNVLLKSMQATACTIFSWLKREHTSSIFGRIAYVFNSFIYRRLLKKTDYAKKGGSLLLGVNHPVVLAHGCSTEEAIKNAILFAHDIVKRKVIEKFNRKIEEIV